MGLITGAAVMDAARRLMDGRFVWGERDCCTAACDLFAELHGIDPMAALRGAYRSRGEALAVMAAAGGLPALAARLAAEAGLQPLAGPARPGDIGVVDRPDMQALVVSIGRGWVGKAPRGMTIVQDGLRGAWRA